MLRQAQRPSDVAWNQCIQRQLPNHGTPAPSPTAASIRRAHHYSSRSREGTTRRRPSQPPSPVSWSRTPPAAAITSRASRPHAHCTRPLRTRHRQPRFTARRVADPKPHARPFSLPHQERRESTSAEHKPRARMLSLGAAHRIFSGEKQRAGRAQTGHPAGRIPHQPRR